MIFALWHALMVKANPGLRSLCINGPEHSTSRWTRLVPLYGRPCPPYHAAGPETSRHHHDRWVGRQVGFHFVMGDWNCVPTDEKRVRTEGREVLQAAPPAAHHSSRTSHNSTKATGPLRGLRRWRGRSPPSPTSTGTPASRLSMLSRATCLWSAPGDKRWRATTEQS